jgi:transposase
MGKEPPIPAELWVQIPPAAQAALLVVFARYEQRITALEQQVLELRQQLSQNSTNSSKPPSSDPPAVKRAPPKPPSGKRRGGQPGHSLCQRPLLEPTQVHDRKPSQCRRCQCSLAGADPTPLRHQILELPPIRPLVTEYRLHRLCCPACGTSTCADLPDGVPTGTTGPRLQATLGVLTGAYRLSKRQAEQLCADLLHVPICAGQICALEQQTTAALGPALAEARQYVQAQSVNMDETGWRQARQRAWLWVAVTGYLTLFEVVASRGAAVAQRLLGKLGDRIVTTDRYSAYNWLPLYRRQICWAHLKRDFQAMVDRKTAGSAIGEELLCWAQDVFGWWYRVRDGTMQRSTFATYVQRIRPRFRATLEQGLECGCARTAGTCREILKVEAALWTFVRVAGIEPTNNAAERALRGAVLWRRGSQGTDSVPGSRFVGSILTVVASCRQQGRNVLEYVTECCAAALRGEKPPSLLPQPSI